ncbi:MAG: hypothetical protein EAZ24_07945 [Burkholderiales bacterium]|nr:MAG: hypothetical protein EAZ24_07945 [Burkholderiales bacterium]TAG77159.1 MAG: hypothetical protein EAZ21_15390 [Betaproteobacteria bacterium]
MRLPVVTCLSLIVFLFGCISQPLEPTFEAKRVMQVKAGQTRAQVEAIMGYRGAIVSYPAQPGETVQVWAYSEHHRDMCLMVTYDRSDTVIAHASIERDKGPFRFTMVGGCR